MGRTFRWLGLMMGFHMVLGLTVGSNNNLELVNSQARSLIGLCLDGYIY